MTLPENTSASFNNADAILDFWFADGLRTGWPAQDMSAVWFGGGAALDQEIRERFGADVMRAVNGGLRDWEPEPLSRLALIILLDQFTRNVFRGTGQAFHGDARAQRLVLRTIGSGEDRQLPWVGRVFLYMPLMHACFTRRCFPPALRP